jgi:hypothetical protein
MRRPSIWLTFHPLISSPICTRSIFAVPERTMARARSPSTTIPSRVTSGGAGGGSGARSTGGGGGAGGRRSDENSGRSRVADRRSSDSVCKGLPRIPAGWSWDCAFAPVTKIEANPSTRTEMLGNDSECVTGALPQKARKPSWHAESLDGSKQVMEPAACHPGCQRDLQAHRGGAVSNRSNYVAR